MMHSHNCLFCKIIAGTIPCHRVYEDSHTLAFLDISPTAKGHTVVIPKEHAETVFGLSDEATQALMLGVQKSMERLQEVLGPAGFNLGLNHNEVAGQTIPHVHMHILPRYEGDGGASVHAIVQAPGDTPVADLAKLFAT
jgi:histidine triad (HIT) family protein